MSDSSSEERKLKRQAQEKRQAASARREARAEKLARPKRRRSLRFRLLWFMVKGLTTIAMLVILAAGALFMAVEAGALDKLLTARAEGALNGAVGPRYVAKVGKTAIRFAHNRQLAIEAKDVTMVDPATGHTVSETGAVRMALDPFKLIFGELNVTRIEADDVHFDTALFTTGEALDLQKMRIDALPAMVEQSFAQLDLYGAFIDRARTDTLEVNGLQLMAAQADGKTVSIGSARFTLSRVEAGNLELAGTVTFDTDTVPFQVVAERKLGKSVALTASVSGVPLDRFGPKKESNRILPDALLANAALQIGATRSASTVTPAIELSATINPGTLRIHDIEQAFDGAIIKAVYDFDKNSLEFLPSALRFGQTNLPFSGGLIDLDRYKPGAGKGFGIDFLVQGGKVFTEGAPDTIEVEGKATGQFLSDTSEIVLDKLTASTRLGSLIGSFRMKFGGTDPELSFVAQTDSAQTQAVKQLWPFWIAPKARRWVTANLFGGTIANAQIAVFIPSERVRDTDGGLLLNDEQLKINFDLTNARMNIAGDIPPLRGSTGHFLMEGRKVSVNLKSGTSYFPTDRSVSIEGGTFTIPDVDQKPILADMDINVSGAADAVAELITYRPIKFLSRTGLMPADLAGNIKANVKARFGLNASDKVEPTWKAAMTLTDVDLLKPFQGRRLTALTGTLDIDQDKAILDTKGKLDGVPMELDATEPVGEKSTVEQQRVMSLAVGGDDLGKLFPSLDQIVGGTLKAKVSLLPNDVQKVEADLAQAVLKVPGTGWTKGAGIPAKANFTITRDDAMTNVKDFSVSGEGFGATGTIQAKAGKLVQASFEKVKLAENDNFSVRIKPIRSGYDVAISGAAMDARAAITALRSSGTLSSPSSRKVALALRAKLDTVYGFGDEKLNNVDFAYAPFNGQNGKLQLSAVSGRKQAVVGQVVADANGPFIQLTTDDAGASFRFLGLYSRLKKGLLNLRIRPGREGSWSGNLDLRDFQLANEDRLQTIVSTPTGKDGRSLNTAVKRDIDVSSERFQRAFAYFTYAGNALQIDNGILRGEQVGATFQGTVRDENGNMDVTGTFMPAYGLNRLFAELPVIGIILGNGRDRGLLGITFKLTGAFEKPNLTINPLSIIAPGIFRQIFEFQ